jgi:signal peptidase I
MPVGKTTMRARTKGDPELGDGERPIVPCIRALQRICVGVALLFAVAQQALLASYRVSGSSMTPAFLDGDRVVVARMPGFFGEPRRGETVIARVHGEVVIKRVAGLPGDTVALEHGLLRRDGELANDVVPARFHDACDFEPVVLGEQEYFLLGDHRGVSIDSREFGPVPRDAILGRVILRVPQQGAGLLAGALAHASFEMR